MPHHALMPSVSVKHIWPSLHVPALHGFCAVQCAPVPAMDSYPSSHWQVRPRQRALSPHVSLDVHDKAPVLHVSISSCFFVGHMHLGAKQVNMRGLCELLEHNASVIFFFFNAAHTVRLRTLPVRRLCTCTLRHCSSHCSGKSWLWEGGVTIKEPP